MVKMILAFLVLTVLIAGGISLFRSLSGKDQWKLTKIVFYAIMCSAIAVGLLTAVVVLF